MAGKMKKTGILTFHCAHNYGAVLQAYATQELLREAGYDVEVVDYRPDYLVAPYSRMHASRFKGKDGKLSLRHVISEIILLPFRCVRYRLFEDFINNRLSLSERVTRESFRGEYETIVTGSDQVWNRQQTGGLFDPMYMFDFAFEKGARRYVADAVSMAVPDEGEDVTPLRNALMALDAVSAREPDAVSYLSTLTSKPVAHVLDPVLQLSPDRWKTMVRQVNRKRPYILVYRLRDHVSIDHFVRELAEKRDADVVEILAFPNARKLFKARQAVSVEDFISLISCADTVVTTSFHGAVFSTVFHRPFYTFSFGNGKDSRLASLLGALGLEDRMLPLGASVPQDTGCSFDTAEVALERLRRESADFVLNSI